MAGSAPVARRWVLVEHPGPWARQALDTPPFAGALGRRVDEALLRHHARLVLIRRPGRQEYAGEARQWFVVDTATGDAITGTWTVERDLDEVLTALGEVNGPFAEPCPDLILVCTHGIRDACCAIKGRPIAGTLSRAFEDAVWECSHLNGHRFAGTALLLPDGACYGRLDQADAVRVVTNHRAGRVEAAFLRGLTELGPAAQAAHAWGLAELAAASPDADRSVADIEIGTVGEEHLGLTRVEVVGLRPHGESVHVDVRREELAPAPLSCGKPAEAAAAYRVATLAAAVT